MGPGRNVFTKADHNTCLLKVLHKKVIVEYIHIMIQYFKCILFRRITSGVMHCFGTIKTNKINLYNNTCVGNVICVNRKLSKRLNNN